MLFVNRSKYL